jgi:hypothetical protein
LPLFPTRLLPEQSQVGGIPTVCPRLHVGKGVGDGVGVGVPVGVGDGVGVPDGVGVGVGVGVPLGGVDVGVGVGVGVPLGGVDVGVGVGETVPLGLPVGVGVGGVPVHTARSGFISCVPLAGPDTPGAVKVGTDSPPAIIATVPVGEI